MGDPPTGQLSQVLRLDKNPGAFSHNIQPKMADGMTTEIHFHQIQAVETRDDP
jgi:hypothetical protein